MDKGQGAGGGEDRADESDVQHETAGISAQATIRLLRDLNGRHPAEGGGKRPTR